MEKSLKLQEMKLFNVIERIVSDSLGASGSTRQAYAVLSGGRGAYFLSAYGQRSLPVFRRLFLSKPDPQHVPCAGKALCLPEFDRKNWTFTNKLLVRILNIEGVEASQQ